MIPPISLHAIGKASAHSHMMPVMEEYQKRLLRKVKIYEWDVKKSLEPHVRQEAETQLLLKQCPPQAYVIALDAGGKSFTSEALAKQLAQIAQQGNSLIFTIGGSDGFTDAMRARANMRLSFGQLTWPHMLARAMLLEQLYRVSTILAGHPYHK